MIFKKKHYFELIDLKYEGNLRIEGTDFKITFSPNSKGEIYSTHKECNTNIIWNPKGSNIK